ncbi:apolipoprotein C-II isoform X1 [Petaurus breviceps papuanus]|uniref:apolipoprotein C-II isoform X1 n=1 Tax=Petaurus breviceps papuanus TaxID=3040969 RepID=UPI0036DD70D3
MGTRTRPTLTFLLLLLVLVSVAQAARPRFRREESPGLLSKVQSHIFDYWESAKAKAQELYEKVQIPRVDENLRHVYDKGSEAMTTYTGILTDQIFHMLKGEQ